MNWEVKIQVPTELLSKTLMQIEAAGLGYEIIQREASETNLNLRHQLNGNAEKVTFKKGIPLDELVPPSTKTMAEKAGDVITAEYDSGSTITKEEVKKVIKQIGGNPSGISYYIGHLRSNGVIGSFDFDTQKYQIV